MQILNIFHVLIAIGLVAFVLIQKGQGATAGAAFGSGASGTVFGARGAGNFLSKSTWVLAGLFCAISLTMAVVVSRTVDEPGTDLGVIASTPNEQPVQTEGDTTGDPAVDDLVRAVEEAAESQSAEDVADLPVADYLPSGESEVADDVPEPMPEIPETDDS